MWPEFALAFALCSLMLFVLPFLVLASVTRLGWSKALSLAPLLGIVSYTVAATMLAWAGIAASPLSVVGPLLAVGIVCLVARLARLRTGDGRAALSVRDAVGAVLRGQPPTIVVYLLVGVVATTIVFVWNLDTAASVFQAYDNGSHLSAIRAFLESGDFSLLNSSIYVTPESVAPTVEDASFYPRALYCIVALTVQMSGASIPVALNATNAVMLGVVFPLGAHALLDQLFEGDRRKVLVGSLACVAFPSGCWDFVAFGPLYPMLLSYALVPGALTCFLALFDRSLRARARLRWLLLFVLGCVAIAVSQPCGIFLMAVFLAPFCVWQAYAIPRELGRPRWLSLFCAAVTAVAIALIWMVCYKLPFLSSTVDFTWPAIATVPEAIVDVLLLSTRGNSAHPVLAAFVLVGLVLCATRGRWRWLSCSYLITCVIYVVCAATDGELKQVLGGFWYTDQHRLGVNMALVAIPLAVVGALFVYDRLRAALGHLPERARTALPPQTAAGLSMAVLWAVVFCPSLTVSSYGTIETAFGGLENEIYAENSMGAVHVLDAEEVEFALEALEMIPEGSLIINSPNDGSAFLYGLYGTNVYYRRFALSGLGDEFEESEAIRLSLNELATNEDVRAAVEETGARYVLLLDQGDAEEGERAYFWSYFPEQWVGIESITDDTPGFEVVLARDDMRLYRIVGVD